MSSYTINFYREECSTHGKDIDGCEESCEIAEKEYEVNGHVSRYTPARLHGHPDSWAPAEGGEVEDIAITLDGKPCDDSDFSEKDFERMTELLSQAAADDDGGDDYEPDDYDDGPADSFDPPDRDCY